MRLNIAYLTAVGALSSGTGAATILISGVTGPLWAGLWGLSTGCAVALASVTGSALAAPDRLDWVEDYSTLRRP